MGGTSLSAEILFAYDSILTVAENPNRNAGIMPYDRFEVRIRYALTFGTVKL
jgi:hypothetical protein